MHTCGRNEQARAYLAEFRRILADMEAGMTGAELCGSISHNFIVQMIPHHRAAIEMSENILQYTGCAALEKIARGIITEQTESIAQMEAALSGCTECRNSREAVCCYQNRVDAIMRTMFRDMACAPGTNCLDADFMREMIPHHLGAIRMSENALAYPICPELCPILEAIIRSQKRGVRQMQNLLRCL